MMKIIGWWRVFLLMCAALLCDIDAISQEVKVRAGFVSDSTRVGDETLFYLTATYPSNQQVVFPDSTFIFSPFEIRRKDYFPTTTKDTLSYDSAIYALRTFEIEKAQTLKLPIFLINALDCTRVFSNRDTIALRRIVKHLPDSLTADLPLKATTAYQHVPQQINAPLIIIITSFLALLSSIGWVVFGPSVNRYYKIRRLQKMHDVFSSNYQTHLQAVQAGFSAARTEAAVVEWRKYMEELSRRPFTKLTSSEMTLMEKDDDLGTNLRVVDSAIYGSNTNVVDSLITLKGYADQRFQNIIAEVKNG
jgi:hypothetical protein